MHKEAYKNTIIFGMNELLDGNDLHLVVRSVP